MTNIIQDESGNNVLDEMGNAILDETNVTPTPRRNTMLVLSPMMGLTTLQVLQPGRIQPPTLPYPSSTSNTMAALAQYHFTQRLAIG